MLAHQTENLKTFIQASLKYLVALDDVLLAIAAFFGLLRQKNMVDVKKNTTMSNGNFSLQFTKLFIDPYRQQHMPWDNPGVPVVMSCIFNQLKHLSCKIYSHDIQ